MKYIVAIPGNLQTLTLSTVHLSSSFPYQNKLFHTLAAVEHYWFHERKYLQVSSSNEEEIYWPKRSHSTRLEKEV